MTPIVILPGFSQANKLWSDQAAEHLKDLGECLQISWPHWQTGLVENDWTETEIAKLEHQIEKPVNIVAKSIGTYIAAGFVGRHPELIEKIVLCGIPLNDIEDEKAEEYRSLAKLKPSRVLGLQNDNDPHGTYQQVSELMADYLLSYQLIKEHANNHEYLYFEQINTFLFTQTSSPS